MWIGEVCLINWSISLHGWASVLSVFRAIIALSHEATKRQIILWELKMADFTSGNWIFEPKEGSVNSDSISITTEPETDFWQRTYYGFRNDNAPALQIESDDNFTFTTKVSFNYHTLFDQCGVIIYIDSENWFKASGFHRIRKRRVFKIGKCRH